VTEFLDYTDAIEDALTDEVWRPVTAFARRREKLDAAGGVGVRGRGGRDGTRCRTRCWGSGGGDRTLVRWMCTCVIRSRTSAAI